MGPRRAAAILAAAVAATSLGPFAASPAAAGTLTPSASAITGFITAPATAAVNTQLRDPITVTGGARVVQVQAKGPLARTWTTIATLRSLRTGAVTVVETAREGTWQWRVSLPASGRLPAAVSPARSITGKRATSVAGFAPPTTVVAGQLASVAVRVTPAAIRTVWLQSRATPTGTWATRATSVSNAAGSASFTSAIGGTLAGSAQWRVLVPATGVAFEGSSPVASVAVVAAPAVSLNVSEVTGGVPGPRTVSVTARDAYGNTAIGYRGTVHFTSSDPQAVLPSDYTFTPSDSGSHAFVGGVSLRTVGSRTVTATDVLASSITGQASANVVPGPAVSLQLSGLTNSTAGASQSVTVTARDAYGNTAIGYRGTVHFTSSDPQAVLPGDYTFTPSDSGSRAFVGGVSLRTVGGRSITVTDTTTSSLTTTALATVTPSTTTALHITGDATSTAGMPLTATVVASDAFGNVTPDFAGTVHFGATDVGASLPVDYTFAPGDAGSHTFSGAFTFTTAGSQTLTVSDVALTATSDSTAVTVSAGTATQIQLTGVSAGGAGTRSITITARDAYGNVATSYRGTVHVTSSDGAATVPGDYTFGAGDFGTHTFVNGVTLRTPGSTTVTAADAVNALNDASTVTITAGVASTLTASGLAAATAGAPQSITITLRDAYGNVATGYRGTVHFTTTDGGATLPANYTFIAADSGTHTFTGGVTLVTSGSQTVTATDTISGSLTSGQTVTISAGSAVALSLTGVSGGPIGARTVTVSARDAFGNLAPSYRGTVHFTSSDGAATLPPDFTFGAGDAGAHTFTNGISLMTIGSQSVTVTDTVTGSITGTASATITVAPTAGFVITGFTTTAAGSYQSITVRAVDSLGNTTPAYQGTVRFTSTDLGSSLPANYTFQAADAGTHTFTSAVSLTSAGTQSVTAIDTVNAAVTGSANFTVTPGTAASLQIDGLDGIAGARSPTVTVLDGFGNVATGYRGTLHFSTADPSGTVPADYTFTSGDAGVHTFTGGFTLPTPGVIAVSAFDSVGGFGITVDAFVD